MAQDITSRDPISFEWYSYNKNCLYWYYFMTYRRSRRLTSWRIMTSEATKWRKKFMCEDITSRDPISFEWYFYNIKLSNHFKSITYQITVTIYLYIIIIIVTLGLGGISAVTRLAGSTRTRTFESHFTATTTKRFTAAFAATVNYLEERIGCGRDIG